MRILSCLEVRDQTRVPQDPHVVQLSLHPRFHGALPDGLASVVLRIKALEALFWLTYDQWDLDRAEAVAQEAMQLGAQAEIDSSLAASLRIMLASPAWVGGRLRAGEGASRRKPRD